jgi:hypothetical protein
MILHHHIHQIDRVQQLDLRVQILLARNSDSIRSDESSSVSRLKLQNPANNSQLKSGKRGSGFGMQIPEGAEYVLLQ